ncbi:hypothetical protein HDU79_007666 [Rhizoclosmatium sp. JEL0117]|nr:hypothetical protein HDU79_007666 [Rhizoclosmatium sp. JEL0117]
MCQIRKNGQFETWQLPNGAYSRVFICRDHSTKAKAVGPKTVFIVIPGNPGVLEYYEPFAESVFNNAHRIHPTLNLDVIALQHVGHSRPDFAASDKSKPSIINSWNTFFNPSKEPRPLSLDQQIHHKLIMFDHIRSLYPKDTRFILTGHSIGCFMTLSVLRQRPNVDNLVKVILLFPTIKEIANTPNGKVIQWVATWGVRHTIAFIVMILRPILMFFPIVFYSIVALFSGMTGAALETTVENLLHHQPGFHALTLGDWEMKQVLELDEETVERNHDKLVLYYGPKDKWADESHFKDMKNRFPDIQAILCTDNVQHDFVIHSSEQMARKVVQWI